MTQVIRADELTSNYGSEHCKRLRRHIFSDLSPIAGDLALHYVKIAERTSFEQANHKLQDIHEQLRIEDLNLCAGTEELCAAAKRYAQKCYTARQRTKTEAETYQACLRIVDYYQVKRQILHKNKGSLRMDRGHTGITFRGNSAQLAFTFQGERCRESIPIPATKAAQKELILKRQAILYEIRTGTFDYLKHFPHSKKAQESRKTRPDQYTIGEGLENWLRLALSQCQPSALRDYNSAIYHHLMPTFGDLTIAELTATKVKEWLANLLCSNKRKSNILIPLRQMYDDMFHNEIIDKNPLTRVKNLPIQSREPDPFTQEEISRILNELTGQKKPDSICLLVRAENVRTHCLTLVRCRL